VGQLAGDPEMYGGYLLRSEVDLLVPGRATTWASASTKLLVETDPQKRYAAIARPTSTRPEGLRHPAVPEHQVVATPHRWVHQIQRLDSSAELLVEG
jgi:hypothetical protein